jgi:hypothetical protein
MMAYSVASLNVSKTAWTVYSIMQEQSLIKEKLGLTIAVELQPYGRKNLDGYRRAVVPPIKVFTKPEILPTKICR